MNGYALWSILLLIFGLTTLIAEVFIPSGGALAVITVLAIVGSLIFSAMAWLWAAPLVFAAHFALVLVLVPLCLLGALEILPRTRAGKRMILQGPDGDRLKAPQASTDEKLASLMGRHGLARTALSPGGTVMIDDVRYSAISGESLIDPGSPIVVTGLRGSTLIVSPVAKGLVTTQIPPGSPVPSLPPETEQMTNLREDQVLPATEPGSSTIQEAQLPNPETSVPAPQASPVLPSPVLSSPVVELDPFAQLADDPGNIARDNTKAV